MEENINALAAKKLLTALQQQDLETYESLLAEDAVEGRPQLGERFVGRANIMGLHRDPEGGVHKPEWRRILGSGNVWVGEGVINYSGGAFGDGYSHLTAILEFRNGKMVRGDYYFTQPMEAPEYHTRWAEREEVYSQA